MSDTRREVYFTDMSVCQPGTALSRKRRHGQWRLMNYQAEGISGTLMGAAKYTGAPEVTLPLRVNGWYAISVGFWNPPFGEDQDTVVKLRLTRDPAFTPILDSLSFVGPETGLAVWDRTDLKEAFWKYADLSGQDLIIAQQNKGVAKKSYVAYIKLTPLGREEAADLQKDRTRQDTRKVVAVVDGGSFLENKGPESREEYLEQFELFRHSDVGRVIFAVNYGVTTNYPSQVGVLCGGDGEEFDSGHGKILYHTLHGLLDKGLVPFVMARDHVHSMGLEFHAQFRMGLGDGTLEGEGQGGFAERHPEFRILDKDGTPLPKLSYAFPETRRFLLTMMREVGEQDIDGVNLCFIRGPLFVGYEKPVVDSFVAKSSRGPRDLDDQDERVIRHKASFLTQLVREAKALADEIGTKRGRKLALSAWVESSEACSLFHGYDVRTWLTEKLVDIILGMKEADLVALAKKSGVKLFWTTGSRQPANYISYGLEAHTNEADGITVWDIDIWPDQLPEHWEIIRNLGHRDRVEAFAKNPPVLKKMKMLTVDGFDFGHTYGKGAPGNWPPEMLIMYTNG